ncbi:replicative DNA helicase [Candidatus Hydrogenosomobacter endosymbioticus]|uniref:Replicative DNA helicase n=1 Tax=Candidatus Hydrogenosomobacter endosymbioticus TaxID=2558174 RepID=A0ABM7V9C4_9PROT|nr:replicative DNA helicase [Candidatus Hydrogenosomobacter endosymbioticus]BDB96392.1 replicative DNA helicase [Candidatus Hydrogenosomobacter endosymbioticus]
MQSEITTGKIPFSNEIEQALLSILLYDNSSHEMIPDSLRPEHFYNPLHAKIFKAISLFISKNHVATPITLAQYFKGSSDEDSGEQEYLAELGAMLFPVRNIRDYAEQIYDMYARRELITIGIDIAEDAKKYEIDGPSYKEQLESAEQKLFNLSANRDERSFIHIGNAMEQAVVAAESAFSRDSHVVGVTTGFIALDKLLGGLYESDLIIIAGRPSMGKTSLATNIAFNAARAKMRGDNGGGATVAFFSLEMSASQLAMRLLGQETGVSSDRIRRGAIEKTHLPLFIDVARELSSMPLIIDDSPALSITSLRTKARRMMRKEGLGLIVVDYLQLMTISAGSFGENRVQELSIITRGLKAIAKELNVPVIALSQLSRAVEQRDDKRPQLADLRESGTIEQDADVVMFIYREEYYESRKKPLEGSEKMISWQKQMAEIHNIAEIIIAKQRHGPISTVQLHYDGQKTKFSNLAKNII